MRRERVRENGRMCGLAGRDIAKTPDGAARNNRFMGRKEEVMKRRKTRAPCLILLLAAVLLVSVLTGCGGQTSGVRIVRIGHNQSTNHPTHKGLVAFQEFINEKLGDKYQVEVYPSELLGSQNNMVQLTQTGAIDFCVASNAILDSFSKNYQIFNLPYLFSSKESYEHVMDDESVTGPIFDSTKSAGFSAVTWLDAGTRNFYTVDTQINTPADLKGKKIRVQQSAINIEMMRLLGGSATPMGFGEVYTALQSKIIDGAENNEMALVDNGHGDVCKYYSYDMHQMVPDILIGNNAFLDGMDEADRAVFEEGFKVINQVQREEWGKSIEEAKEKAANEMGVNFSYPDTKPFEEACKPLHESVLADNPNLQATYDAIQEYNAQYPSTEQ